MIRLVGFLVFFIFVGVIGENEQCDTDNCHVKFAFASYYQDNMVLQRAPHKSVIWGYGKLDAKVTVLVMQDEYTTHVQLGTSNIPVWSVTLKPYNYIGGPHKIQAIQEHNGVNSTALISNIMFGDVWVCGGQSNMKFTVAMAFNASYELSLAPKYPNVRVMTVGDDRSNEPLHDFKNLEQPWSVPSKHSLTGDNVEWTYFSSLCWLYGRYLYDFLKVPIGLVSSNWGGTPIETWSSTDALKKCGLHLCDEPDFKLEMRNRTITKVPRSNSALWNAMIHPMLNMTIKGAIWYQGETNYDYHNAEYACSFPAMINDWRDKWLEGTRGQTDKKFPFGFVQISTTTESDRPNDGQYPVIRWRQTANYGYVPNEKMRNTFMAVAMDLADNDSPTGGIHPRDKQTVAARLLLGSMRVAYGRKDINPDGPLPQSAVHTPAGYVVLSYQDDQPLVVTKQQDFAIFDVEVCCDGECSMVVAPIASYSNRHVILDTRKCLEKGDSPKFIRYAWALTPCEYKKCSVYNTRGLPGPPFYIEVKN
uniref:Sialate O-acetylesterase domain-containing protein n=1 Tax=Ciona intestinalis TaxID=7719 RepID=H2Y181_CIOIN